MKRPEPRADLDDVRPYLPDRPPVGVVLSNNENPYEPPDEVLDEIYAQARKTPLNRYPDVAAHGLRAALAEYCDVQPDWIWVGTGSNEILLDLCLAYGGAGRLAMLLTPTYSMHHRQARIAGTTVIDVPRKESFAIDVPATLDAIAADRPDILFVCSPNNPTGTLTPIEDVAEIAEAAPGLVVLDEAYFEFSGVTLVAELGDYPNVVVVRTLSKAFRMAAARIGYAVGQPDTIAPILKVRMPYGQSTFSQLAARIAVERRDEVLSRVPKIVAERDRLYGELLELPAVEPSSSAANFVLFRCADAVGTSAALAANGILVRDFPELGCLRVTAGTRAENDAFLAALRELV